MLTGVGDARAFTLQGFAAALPFLETLQAALDAAGMPPDSLLREYGPDQYEVTLPPKEALRAADEAALLREITRVVARGLGLSASFSPLLAPDIVGNGVHIHFSLWDAGGRPVTHDPEGQDYLSAPASAFAAGVLAHLNAVSAFTAPSAVSPLRLVPHRWSAAFNNLGRQDREAAIRICPVTAREPDARARQFNMEFRAADACASPHLALAAVVLAGTLGIEQGLACPPATIEDLSLVPAGELARRGLARLPATLDEAIGALEADAEFRVAWPEQTLRVYAAHKRGEIAHLTALAPTEWLAAYGRVY
jgi:glutamine synthetase